MAKFIEAFHPRYTEYIESDIPGFSLLDKARYILQKNSTYIVKEDNYHNRLIVLGFMENELTKGLFASCKYIEEKSVPGISTTQQANKFFNNLYYHPEIYE